MKTAKRIRRNATIREAISAMNNSKSGVVLFVDDHDRLIATLTDGDLRCAILKNFDLDSSVERMIHAQKSLPFKTPVTARIGTPRQELHRRMTDLAIHHIPLVDEAGVVVDLCLRDELEPDTPKLRHALIMAGGRGERLRPLTDKTPKPMLPLCGKPMIEHIVCRLKESGIDSIWISVRYKAEQIVDYLQDGGDHGVHIRYLHEDRPLGTAGCLKMIDLCAPLLVINGDVLTNMNFQLLYAYHRRNKAAMTVAARPYTVNVPYGVLNMQGVAPFGPSFKCMEVVGLEEKPSVTYFVNAGVYVIEPESTRYTPPTDDFNMTDLIEGLVQNGKRVASYPVYAYWRDIGTIADYSKAPVDMEDGCLW